MLTGNEMITVVVPVYNSEKYLNRCLNSVMGQTYRNLQVIAIDDGSTDGSGRILDEYAAKDPRMVVLHKKNEGVSQARNDALQLSKGDYIAFVDSDGFIRPDMYEKMLTCMSQQEVQIVLCQWQWQRKDGSLAEIVISDDICGRMNSIHLQRLSCRGGYINGVVCSPWNKLFAREVLEGIFFDGAYGEDEQVNDLINSRGYDVYVMRDSFYIYCENPESATHASFSAQRLHFLDVLEKRIDLFRDDDFIINHTKHLYCNMYIEYYYKLKKLNQTPPRHYSDCFRQISKTVRCDVKFRIRMFLFSMNPLLYQLLTE